MNNNNNTNNAFINNQEYQYMRYLLREYTQHSRRTHELISSSIELLSQQDTRYYNLVNEFMRTIRNNSNQLREVNHYVHHDNENDNDNEHENEHENDRNNTRNNASPSRDDSQSPLPQHMSRQERIHTANRNRTSSRRSTRRTVLENTPIRRRMSLEPLLYNNASLYRQFPLRTNTISSTTSTPLPRTSNTVRPTNRSRLTNLFTRLYSVPEEHTLNVDLQNLSPVHIRPTTEQINNATERLVFNTIENPTNSVCPITQQRFEDEEHVIRIIHCGHIYTSASLQQWFQRNTRCPLCRYDIRNYHPVRAIRNPYRRFTYDASDNSNIDSNNTEDEEKTEDEDDNVSDNNNIDVDNINNDFETNMDNDADNEHSDNEELLYSSRLVSIIDPSTNEDIQSQLPDGVIENIRNLIGNDVNNYIRSNPLQVDNSGSMLFEYSFFFPIVEHDDENESNN